MPNVKPQVRGGPNGPKPPSFPYGSPCHTYLASMGFVAGGWKGARDQSPSDDFGRFAPWQEDGDSGRSSAAPGSSGVTYRTRYAMPGETSLLAQLRRQDGRRGLARAVVDRPRGVVSSGRTSDGRRAPRPGGGEQHGGRLLPALRSRARSPADGGGKVHRTPAHPDAPLLREVPLRDVTLPEIKRWRTTLAPETESTNAAAYRLLRSLPPFLSILQHHLLEVTADGNKGLLFTGHRTDQMSAHYHGPLPPRGREGRSAGPHHPPLAPHGVDHGRPTRRNRRRAPGPLRPRLFWPTAGLRLATYRPLRRTFSCLSEFPRRPSLVRARPCSGCQRLSSRSMIVSMRS